MSLTLRDALGLVEPLRLARVVAGERGLDRIVESVNVMEVPDILEWVHPGELLVTTLYPVHDDPAALEELVPRLAAKGLAGLAITPGSYIDRIPSSMIEKADELDFPLIELPPKVSFIDIIQPLTSKILNLQANELRQSEAILRQFVDLLLQGGDYPDIAHVMAQLLGHPVTVVDRFRRVLGTGFLVGKPRPSDHFLEEDVPGEWYLGRAYQPEVVAEVGPVVRLSVSSPAGPISHIACPVKVGSWELGRIIVWGDLPCEPRSLELVVLEHGARAVALKLMELRSISQVEQQLKEQILEGLLSREPAVRENALVLASRMGIELKAPFLVLVVAPDQPLPPSEVPVAPGRRTGAAGTEHTLQLAQRYLRFLTPKASFWRHRQRLVVFFPVGEAPQLAQRDFLVRELVRICRQIEQENPPHTVSVGISALAQQLTEFRHAFRCANQSLELGKALTGKGTSCVTHYQDLGVFRLLSGADSPEDLSRFCQETLGPLLAHPELMRTLRAYLAQGRKMAQAAAELGVHYNTLRYRLKKIRELLGEGWDDPQRRLALELALHLQPLVPPEEG